MIAQCVRAAVVASLVSVVSCAEQPAAPILGAELDGLRLELSMDRTTILVGDSGTITMRLHNSTAAPLRLHFGSTCQILPFVESEAGAIQYPGGGGWACGAMLTSLDVPAGGAVTRTILVRGVGSAPAHPGTSLPPGRYRSFALLEPTPPGPQLRSEALEFEVR